MNTLWIQYLVYYYYLAGEEKKEMSPRTKAQISDTNSHVINSLSVYMSDIELSFSSNKGANNNGTLGPLLNP